MSSAGNRYYHAATNRRPVQQVNDIQRGLAAGQAIGGILGQFGSIYKNMRADQVANQLMNAQPTAAANAQAQTDPDPDPNPDGTDNLSPTAATDPSGTQNPDPFTGGVAELKQRQAAASDDLETQIKQAQLANSLAKLHGTDSYAERATPAPQGVTLGGGSSSRWSQYGGQTGQTGQTGRQPRGGKPAPYEAGSVDAETDDSADNMNHVAADFDAAMGGQKGSYAKFLANAPNMKPDANGNFSLTDKNGNVTTTVMADDVPHWINRTNAARRNQGLSPITIPGVPLGQGANPSSPEKPGSSAANPIILQSKIQPRALPYGTFVKDPNTGQTFTINRPPT